MSSFLIHDLPTSLADVLNDDCKNSFFPRLVSHILMACRIIGDTMRDGGFSSAKIGSQNSFGDSQLDVDVKTDAVIFDALKKSGVVHIGSSEENPLEVPCGGTEEGPGFSVAFDPLDGSSIIDANFAVGSIFGIWQGNGLLNRCGREQCGALITQYGPRVTTLIAVDKCFTKSGEMVAMELTLVSDGWVVTLPRLSISPKAKTFAPGNLRATADNPAYQRLVSYWIENKYTLRYSGGLVPDVYHIFIKGQGVLANASSPKAKAKLRLLFEAAPIALIVEAAGGMTCACASEAGEAMSPCSLLDVVISDLDKRVGVCYGSSEEVQRFISHIYG
mmetsp:Transcript_167/g.153  ORF Transcript_167/g.153 Transcript_167/m.153 type:complete len:332 (+) Transcript_167:64-1059(+)